jgi:uncharacterized small protein (DUF1192 family)
LALDKDREDNMTIDNLIADLAALTARVTSLETEVAALKATKAPKAPKTSAAKADADTLYKVRAEVACPVKGLYSVIWTEMASKPSFRRGDVEPAIKGLRDSGKLASRQSDSDLSTALWAWRQWRDALEVVPAATPAPAPVLDLPQEPAAAPVAEDKAPAEVIDLAGERPTEPAADAPKKGKNKPRVQAS